MFKKFFALFVSLIMMLAIVGCDTSGGKVEEDIGFIHINDYTIKVDALQKIDVLTDIEGFELLKVQFIVDSENEENALFVNGNVYGLKGDTTTVVTAKYKTASCSFSVTVLGARLEESKYSGELFEDILIESVSALSERDDFINGVDISSLAAVLDARGQYYDQNGNPVSLLLQLKNSGVNYVRVRLWNDPVSPSGKSYGGGNNDLETAIRILAPAKALGLKILLCLHYSDFWADPSKQVIPKAWWDITDSDTMAQAIKTFTKNTISVLANNGATPDMVQIGNEITGGMLRQTTTDLENIKNSNLYQNADSSISGTYNSENFIKYLKAGIEAVNEFNSDILTMIHIDRGANNSRCRDFYDRMVEQSVEFDVIGLSYYSFYHGNITAFSNNISDLATRYGKKIVVAETSYAFTTQNHSFNSSIFASATNNKAWAISPQGQADKIRAIANELAGLENDLGLGLFYWEPAWLPVSGAGWADAGTLGTWADQALFSYDGVALPSLDVFNLIKNSSK